MTTKPLIPLYRSPRRFLFIASIGNPAPYTGTRHSAGHVLLDALQGPLHDRIGLKSSSTTASAAAAVDNGSTIFYSTWKSPALMNVSGPPVLRHFRNWLANRQKFFDSFAPAPAPAPAPADDATATVGGREEEGGGGGGHVKRLLRGSAHTPVDVDTRELSRFRPTLVILHDELEAAPGRVKVRMGGPEQASLRGHRGLISIIDSLRGARLMMKSNPHSSKTKSTTTTTTGPAVSVMRLGIGIGRPASRERQAVADYVLGKLTAKEIEALHGAVPEVVDLLVKEMYREGDD